MTDVTTFCTLWHLDIPKRPTLFLTDHDERIVYDGRTYDPRNGATGALAETRAGLAVNSGGLKTSLTLPDISTDEIRSGVLDGAQLSEFRHDWRSGETVQIAKGRMGEVSFSGDEVSVEWLGQASLLDRSTGRVFSRQCDASFGDDRCGLSASDFEDGTICPRTFAACRDQFTNTVNFRGFPYLLGDDVVQAGVRNSDRRDGTSRYR